MVEKSKPFYSRTEKSSDTWETPQYFFDLLNEEFSFTLDPCASDENHKCEKYFTKDENGLIQDWNDEIVFVNPPFSNMYEWVKKCYEESLKNTTVVMILPARIDTKYWHEFIMKAYEIRFCVRRVNFLRNGERPKNGSTFGLAIVVFKITNRTYPILSSYYHYMAVSTV